MYTPKGHYRDVTREREDFVEIIPVLSDEALSVAMLALGTMALGKQTRDTNITRQGRGLYSKALVAMRTALQDPLRSRSTAVLAIPRVMALFELMFGANVETDNRAKSWLSHTEGEMALIVARGAHAYSVDDAAHFLFVDARYRTLLAAIRTRKTSFLNEEAWRTQPWQSRVKTPNDSLLDLMAAIPEILQQGVERDGEMSLGLEQNGTWDARKCCLLGFAFPITRLASRKRPRDSPSQPRRHRTSGLPHPRGRHLECKILGDSTYYLLVPRHCARTASARFHRTP
jgi:hypothetical protein